MSRESGAGIRDLLQGIQGDCKLSSKDGKFRALRTDSIDAVRQAPSAIVNALDTVSSLFGKKSDKIGEALVEAAGGLVGDPLRPDERFGGARRQTSTSASPRSA